MFDLLGHPKIVDGIYPPRAAYQPWITVTPNHWYWDRDEHPDHWELLSKVPDERHLKTPLFHWDPYGGRSGKYTVARLLWCDVNNHTPKKYEKLVLKNTCGWYPCVNPSHWIDKRALKQWTLPKDSTATLVQRSKSVGVFEPGSDNENPERIGTRSTPVIHIVAEDSAYTMCAVGRSDKNVAHADKGSVITCDECLKEWRILGRPLLEVAHVTLGKKDDGPIV